MFATMSVPMYASTSGRASVGQGYSQRGTRSVPMPIFKGPTLSSYPYAPVGAFDLGYMSEQPADTRQRDAPTMARSMSRSVQYQNALPPPRTNDERVPQRSRHHSNNYSYQPPSSSHNMYFYNPSATASTKSDISGTEYDETSTPASFSSPALSVDSTLAIKSPLFSGSSLGGEDTPNTSPSSSINELDHHVKSDMPHYGGVNGVPRPRHDSIYAPQPPPKFSRSPSQMADYSRHAHRPSHPPSRSSSVSTTRAERNSTIMPEGQVPSCVRQPDHPNFTSSNGRMEDRGAGSSSGATSYAPPPPPSSHQQESRGGGGGRSADIDVGTSDVRFFTDSDLDLAERGSSHIHVTLKVAPKPSRPLRKRSQGPGDQDSHNGHGNSDNYEPSSPFLSSREFDKGEPAVTGRSIPPPAQVTTIARSSSPASSVGQASSGSGGTRSRGHRHQPDHHASFPRPGSNESGAYVPSKSKYDNDPMLMPSGPSRAEPSSSSDPSYRPISTYAPHLTASPEPVVAFSQQQHPPSDADSETKHKRRQSRAMDQAEHRRSPSAHSSDSSHSSHSGSRRSGPESERMKHLPNPPPSAYHHHAHHYYPHPPPPQPPTNGSSSRVPEDAYRRQSFYNMAPVVLDDLPGSAKATITRSSSRRTTTAESSGGAIQVRVNERSSTYEISSPISDVSELQEFMHHASLGAGAGPVPVPSASQRERERERERERVEPMRRGEKPDTKRRSSDSEAMRPFHPIERERRYTDSAIAVSDPLKRGVRWNENLICPSPIFPHQRRKGWFNKKGEQLWTNDGAYKPPAQGDEYPLDLADYPECGDGWMNEEGIRIDMHHRLIPKCPLKPALKRR